MAFSNVPGILKPIKLSGSELIMASNYIQANGHCGMTVSIFTFVNYVKISCCVDDSIMKEPALIVELIQKHLESVMKMSQIDIAKYQSSSIENSDESKIISSGEGEESQGELLEGNRLVKARKSEDPNSSVISSASHYSTQSSISNTPNKSQTAKIKD